MQIDQRFWQQADALVTAHRIEIDRPKGSSHPKFAEIIYPLDYGFLAGTKAMDGGGVDVWRGSCAGAQVSGVIITIDTFKRDAEVKLLVGCTPAEMQLALQTHNTYSQAGMLVVRPA